MPKTHSESWGHPAGNHCCLFCADPKRTGRGRRTVRYPAEALEESGELGLYGITLYIEPSASADCGGLDVLQTCACKAPVSFRQERVGNTWWSPNLLEPAGLMLNVIPCASCCKMSCMGTGVLPSPTANDHGIHQWTWYAFSVSPCFFRLISLLKVRNFYLV